MVGGVAVQLKTNRCSYDFRLVRKINYILGNSGSGKTTLVNMIRALQKRNKVSNICVLEDNVLNKVQITLNTNNVNLFIADENFVLLYNSNFAELVKDTDAYFLFITRTIPKHLPCSIEAVFKFNYIENTQTNILIPAYSTENLLNSNNCVIEDYGSGRYIFSKLLNVVGTLKGNGVTYDVLRNFKNVNIIMDGEGAGAIMRMVVNTCNYWMPRSLEYLILLSGIFRLDNELTCTENYADVSKYLSWEKYYYDLLHNLGEKYNRSFTKSTVSSFYVSDDVLMRIAENLPHKLNPYLNDKLTWCRNNAPEALQNCTDNEILELMSGAYANRNV